MKKLKTSLFSKDVQQITVTSPDKNFKIKL